MCLKSVTLARGNVYAHRSLESSRVTQAWIRIGLALGGFEKGAIQGGGVRGELLVAKRAQHRWIRWFANKNLKNMVRIKAINILVESR
jgi:hypothetical protein